MVASVERGVSWLFVSGRFRLKENIVLGRCCVLLLVVDMECNRGIFRVCDGVNDDVAIE